MKMHGEVLVYSDLKAQKNLVRLESGHHLNKIKNTSHLLH
jgi:hypothetical protein